MRSNAFASICTIVATLAALCLLPARATAQQTSSAADAVYKGAAAKPVPRLPDGHPDLNGRWGSAEGGIYHEYKDSDGTFHSDLIGRAASKEEDPDGKLAAIFQTEDYNKRLESIRNVPPYKPELLAKVHELDLDENLADPITKCHPAGVPRVGPPQRILQTAGWMVFLYSGENGNYWRLIPADGRAHRTDLDPSYFGDSVAHWEGNTLVVDVTGFNDDTWFSTSGWFHSEALHVVERFTREGDFLHYDVTVEDPKVLTKPWVMDPRTVALNTDPSAEIYEQARCQQVDAEHYVNHDHF